MAGGPPNKEDRMRLARVLLQLRRSSLFLSVLFALITIAGIGSASRAYAQGNREQNIYSLGEAALIDSQGTAYFSTPDGSIAAIRLDSGAQLWMTPKGKVYRPMAISGKFLVTQQEHGETAAGKHLGIACLRLTDGGEHFATKVELPESAWASIKDGLGSLLRARVVTAANNKMTIAWVSERRMEVRGMAPDDDENNENESQTPLQPTKSEAGSNSGAVEIDLNGNVTPLDRSAAPARFLWDSRQNLRQDLPDEQRLKGLPESQYASADHKHILTSVLAGDERDLNKYQWTIYSSVSKDVIGTITSPFPTAPFYVSGSTLIYQLRPFMTRDSSNRMVRSPLKLVAVNLGTGSKVWERPVLDMEYYGPFPP